MDGVVSFTNNLVVDETPDEDADYVENQDMNTDKTEENNTEGQVS